jgi:hypothetical protein
MPADGMQGDAWREVCRAVVEFDALRKFEPHDPDHVFDPRNERARNGWRMWRPVV